MKDKKYRIITSVITMLPTLVGLLLWNVLPEKLPTHWGMNGEIDGWGSKAFAIFGIPLIMLAFHWFCIWAAGWDKRNFGTNEKVLKIVLLIFPVMSLINMGMIYGAAMGWELSMSNVMLILIGVLFIAIGNYLPKCRQNSTLGIRLPWTLYSEENWNRTHRFGGKMWVIGGIGFLLLSFAPEEWFGYLMLGLVILLAVVPTMYSWLLYKKQVRTGSWTQSEGSRKAAPRNKWLTGIATGVALVLTILVVLLLFTGDIHIHYSVDYFKVEASYWDDCIVYYDGIASVEYRNEGVGGSREWGFGSPRLLMGLFRNEEFGDYTRYTYAGEGPCVVLRLEEDALVLGGKTAEETKEIYESLLERMD